MKLQIEAFRYRSNPMQSEAARRLAADVKLAAGNAFDLFKDRRDSSFCRALALVRSKR